MKGMEKIPEDQKPEYPYGTQMSLKDDHVDALGLEDVKPGDEGEMLAKFKVTGTRKEDMGGGKKSKSVDIQVTDCAMKMGGMETMDKKSSPRDLGIGPKAAKRMEGM